MLCGGDFINNGNLSVSTSMDFQRTNEIGTKDSANNYGFRTVLYIEN